jgi:hypothetical protein
LTSLALYLDPVVEELFESSGVKDIVGCGNRVVDVELVDGLGAGGFGGSGLGLQVRSEDMSDSQGDSER